MVGKEHRRADSVSNASFAIDAATSARFTPGKVCFQERWSIDHCNDFVACLAQVLYREYTKHISPINSHGQFYVCRSNSDRGFT